MTHRLVDGAGLWRECFETASCGGRAALFLDRDGVIVEECHYLRRPDDVQIIAGTGAAIRELNARGVPVIIVTNQAGIGRGYYGWTDFEQVQNTILDGLKRDGAAVNAVLACAYHEAAEGRFRVAGHAWRKPNPGMLLAAAEATGCDLSRSAIIGDRRTDLEAGANAGLRRGILVETGYGMTQAAELRDKPVSGMHATIAPDAAAAMRALGEEGWGW
jgi:D-glycero-D-manno-heptose 1,7-bisphosphate phosphatase